MAGKDYATAIALYTSAIQADPTNAVYYANRAAAYSQNNQHALAIEGIIYKRTISVYTLDSQQAITMDPTYSKAYSRMAHAHFCMNDYAEAVAAYEKGYISLQHLLSNSFFDSLIRFPTFSLSPSLPLC